MSGRNHELGQRYRDGVREPGCELRSGLLVAGDDVFRSSLGLGRLVGVEDEIGDRADRPGSPGIEFLIQFGGRTAHLSQVPSRPQSISMIVLTFLMLTPCTSLSAMARIIARSLRTPRTRALG